MNISKEDFINKYGDIDVAFSSYYKYVFSFTGLTNDLNTIDVNIGGDCHEIYRETVTPDDVVKIKDLDIIDGFVYADNGDLLESFCD